MTLFAVPASLLMMVELEGKIEVPRGCSKVKRSVDMTSSGKE